ncbi:LOW QUALITY PROTEIN: mitochondrial sodium/calcium exchanger protein-like [Brienomyrus brachyistius]|uniref:mitochondrial sodium/calcium exchanger protein-like n=1 Tax=Brienomyrus brachyistius TaxID=42636 RepID=UPI0020B25E9D|nr:mitochondrial sodium/calcium exchanger protein-like [Brienomyrus brachyistius]XP_048841698.1 mitochondrial sodium/calcium exchanger protein-like [Brienomyrus brachyistius]XP_048841704.1 mitochondrial sodium/calcium exchanger protein-like [Brienomyrus brachyistius]XP_048861756.1 LOW QUALITY PROTEIN: mitochondrial sodium/calcium exchanger protein-like [Brienomyrus brachyistius]
MHLKEPTEECHLVMRLNESQRCFFIRNTPDCNQDGGFLNYLETAFCLFPTNLLPLAIFFYVLWLLFLFIVLGLTASKFFCPNLSAISATLKLTHNVAGVTFLALGNGAPDVFSAMAAFSHPQTAGLAIGALFGAGIFVTTIVAGSVALVKPFTVASRPFLRDVIFYMAAVFWTFLILYKGQIHLGEALGYLCLYVGYVFTVIISAYIYNRQKHFINGPLQNGSNHVPDLQSDTDESSSLPNSSIQDYEYQPLLTCMESTSQIFLKSLNPVDIRKWRRKPLYWRAFKVIKVPIEVILLLSVPVVDPDKEDRNWKRPLNCLHLITGPLICVLTFQSGEYGLLYIQGGFPVWALTLLIGLFLCAIVFWSTTNYQPPRFHFLFSLLGFLVSAMWMNTAATEVVSLLRTLGVVFSLSNTVLGLTLLAWGNSIGDCFSDITIARQGYPRMAISACFGGIIFNMVFGIGLGCLLQMFAHNNVVKLQPEGLLVWVLAVALGCSLAFSFILVPLQCFHLGRPYGAFLLLFYAVFLLVALLTEFGKIKVG